MVTSVKRAYDGNDTVVITMSGTAAHKLALVVSLMEQLDQVSVPDEIKDLRVRLDAELVGNPSARAYVARMEK